MTTIPVEVSSSRPDQFVSPTSRYITQNVVYYGENRLITFDTYLRRPYEPQGDENVMVITKGVEYRPDLVSFDVYGYPDAWWRILEANSMKDVFEFVAGKTIMIPKIG